LNGTTGLLERTHKEKISENIGRFVSLIGIKTSPEKRTSYEAFEPGIENQDYLTKGYVLNTNDIYPNCKKHMARM